MLTKKQSELLRYIHERLKETGVPPSFDEMKDALDLRSKSGIYRLIMALEERGFIRRLPNRARALEVLRLPESSTPATPRAGRFAPSVIEGNLGKSRPVGAGDSGDANQIVAIPVMGRIAAGTPISALQSRSHSIALPPDLLSGGEHYALEVRGDSMIEAGILDGDTVVIKKQDTAEFRRHCRRADRRRGGDPEAPAQARRLHRSGSRQSGLRDPHFRTGPRQHPGQADQPRAQILISARIKTAGLAG